MKVPFNWLKSFLDLPNDISVEEVVEKLLEHSCEVEGVDNPGASLKNVFTAQILDITPHPDAEKLVVCHISTGKQNYQIVTGAKNVRKNHRVPVALDGANLPGNVAIKTSKLRGVTSEGMLCSEVELGIAAKAEGIMILPDDTPLGIPIGTYLGIDEAILTLGILPNRGDLMSIRGIARELSVIYKCPIKEVSTYHGKSGNSLPFQVNNLIPKYCSRYMGAAIKGVTIKPSPEWLQRRLQLSGVNPINNIVDITNYILLELGHPMHAFDYDKLEGHKIVIRMAEADESLVMLNDAKLILDDSKLIIADAQKPLALAGIMGGKDSSISDSTKDIILEAACFDPVLVRKTSFATALRTESSQRFEKGVDPTSVEQAMRRAIALVLELAGGQVASEIIDIVSEIKDPTAINFNPNRINELLGTNLEVSAMTDILSRLGFSLTKDTIIPPTYRRTDIYRLADVAEEIGRFSGYNLVKPVLPSVTDFSGASTPPTQFHFLNDIRKYLMHRGFNETVSYSMVSPDLPSLLFDQKVLQIKNPLSREQSSLRTNLLTSLLLNLDYNIRHLVADLSSFEIGHIYFEKNSLISEESHIAGIICGAHEQSETKKLAESSSFLTMKAEVENLLATIGIRKYQLYPSTTYSFLHPYQSCQIQVGKELLGVVGQLHPAIIKHFSFKKPVFGFELKADIIQKYCSTKRRYQSFALHPYMKRDMSFWIDRTVPFEEIKKAINLAKAPFFTSVEIFEIYDGKKYGPDKINFALSFTFQNSDGPLTEDQVNLSFQQIVSRLEKTFSLVLG